MLFLTIPSHALCAQSYVSFCFQVRFRAVPTCDGREDSISESDPVHLKIKLFKLTSYFVCPTLRVSQASVENGCEYTETEKKTSSAHCRV